MAFDGLIIADLVSELKRRTIGGRITRIVQPEHDELIITVKTQDTLRILMSADASLPLIYITDTKKEAPDRSPAFCMLLRKYIMGGKIKDVSQPENERVIFIDIEHYDELGDLRVRRLIIEIMGKHSNIIFCEEEEGRLRIIDSIKHVSSAMSAVREVLPGRDYFIPKQGDKLDPTVTCEEEFVSHIGGYPDSLSKAIYMTYTGFSPLMSNELIHRAGFDGETNTKELSGDMLIHLYRRFDAMMQEIKDGSFTPCICFKSDSDKVYTGEEKEEGTPVEFSSLKLTSYEDAPDMHVVYFDSISNVLEEYYAKKNVITNIRQKSADLRKVVANAVERTVKKLELQKKQLKDTQISIPAGPRRSGHLSLQNLPSRPVWSWRVPRLSCHTPPDTSTDYRRHRPSRRNDSCSRSYLFL